MNEKVCPKCGKQNPSDMSFCLNCGQSLAVSGAANYPADSAPTVFVGSPRNIQPTPPQQQFQPNLQPQFQPLAPNLPQQKKSNTGFYLAVFGGIGLIFLLLLGGVGAMVAMNWDEITGNKNKNLVVNTNTNTAAPTPAPTRSNRNTNPSNSLSPSFTPTPGVYSSNSSSDDSSSDNNSSENNGAPRADFDRIWIDYNVQENGQQGMRIHTKLTVYNMKGVDSYLALYFEKSDGTALKDKNRSYYSSDGQVAAYRLLKIDYDPGVYDDLTVFMPYDELDLPRGKYELRIKTDLIYKEGGLIQHLTYKYFDYSF